MKSVPGKALMIYQKAERHGYEKCKKFVNKFKRRRQVLSLRLLYPHEILQKALNATGTEVITLQSACDNPL